MHRWSEEHSRHPSSVLFTIRGRRDVEHLVHEQGVVEMEGDICISLLLKLNKAKSGLESCWVPGEEDMATVVRELGEDGTRRRDKVSSPGQKPRHKFCEAYQRNALPRLREATYL